MMIKIITKNFKDQQDVYHHQLLPWVFQVLRSDYAIRLQIINQKELVSFLIFPYLIQNYQIFTNKSNSEQNFLSI